jgi:hypothetical protein
MPETELSRKLKELGFVSSPDLPGNPDFAHFGFKLALTFSSRDAYIELELDERVKYNLGFKQRFSDLRFKHWHCRRIYKEDSVEETLDHVNHIIVQQEASKIHMPEGLEPTHRKLITLLNQADETLLIEEKTRKRNHPLIWGLRERRKSIEQRLHVVLKPVILKRDNCRCRACGSTENLELARISGGDMAKPERLSKKRIVWVYPDAEKRWAFENMLILCESCHKRFDSFKSRMWRIGYEAINIDQAIELLQSGKLEETPPILKAQLERFGVLLRLSSFRTFFKVLRKAIIYQKKGDLRKARVYLGHVKREWHFLGTEKFLAKEVIEKVSNMLQDIYRLNSTAEIERTEEEIRDYLFAVIESSIQPRMFLQFKETLSKQDQALSKI